MGFLRQIGEYLFLVKRDPNQERTGMMKAMHGMNRISLIVFLMTETLTHLFINNLPLLTILSPTF